ncbi:hypothetical protein LOK74_20465 [Brevibacillus humidisoli]|uniref:hypothetical protein n=1 Tax=Brevibacillus humidisoli TaxID=2895522 RepID=UPI001E4D1211|nr:hypothetical protein [Brevibacillus humidisoli]UFJ40377.1 hypothetical protein LOK74_20465 [Brevibacillus humidisoli]
MDTPAERYEQLVLQEDQVVFGIQTCEHCVTLLLDNLYQSGEPRNQATYHEILNLINEVEQRLRNQWLNIKIQKALLAHLIKKKGDL